MKTFMDRCLEDESVISEIDDYIEFWHYRRDFISLASYLGMTDGEYNMYLLDASTLPKIIGKRKLNAD